MERPPPIEPDGLFDGLRPSWIALGALLDHGLTFVVMLPLLLHFAGADAFAEDAATADRAVERAMADPAFLLCLFGVGLAITAFAAFWAARGAGRLHVRHGGWTAVASAALGALLLGLPGAAAGPAPPWWFDAIALASMLPAGVLGGWLAGRMATSRG